MYGERYDEGYAEGAAAYNALRYSSMAHAANELAPPHAGLASLHWSEEFKRGWSAAARRYWADRTPVRLQCNGIVRGGQNCAERAEFACSWRGQDLHYCLAHRVALDEIVWRNLEHSGEMVREDEAGLTRMYDGPKWGLVNSPPLP